jgi:hypothetical protein
MVSEDKSKIVVLLNEALNAHDEGVRGREL